LDIDSLLAMTLRMLVSSTSVNTTSPDGATVAAADPGGGTAVAAGDGSFGEALRGSATVCGTGWRFLDLM